LCIKGINFITVTLFSLFSIHYFQVYLKLEVIENSLLCVHTYHESETRSLKGIIAFYKNFADIVDYTQSLV